MQENSHNSNTPKLIGAVVISAILIIGVYVFLTKDINSNKSTAKISSSDSNSVQTTQSSSSLDGSTNDTKTQTQSTGTNSSDTSQASSSYKDGSYKASSTYYVPHGSNSITVNVTIKDGFITKVSSTHDYSDRESGMYVDSFDSVISSKAVGKKIDGLSLSRVGGASLTTSAFDEAISQIANQAKS